MIQPVAKLRFVERYCHPAKGWSVFVDVDASEEGRTGSARKSEAAKQRQTRMRSESPDAIEQLRRIGVCVGGRKAGWKACFGSALVLPKGDRDIIAVHQERRLLWIAEVEGDSSGQPEGKIYKALGQLVCAATEMELPGYTRFLSLVAWGPLAGAHLARARASACLGISGLIISEQPEEDEWLFGEAPRSPPNKEDVDPVVEAYKKDVDRTLLREALKLTPEQRLRELMRLQRFAAELRRAGEAPDEPANGRERHMSKIG